LNESLSLLKIVDFMRNFRHNAELVLIHSETLY
jgi:hypothetical protein